MKQLIPAIFLLGLIVILQSPVQAQSSSFTREECAISVDIWLLGESCVMAGLKARYGEYLSLWSIEDADTSESLAAVLLRNRLFPITIASRPTDFGWIQGQPYIDFSLVDKIDTDQVDLDSTGGTLADYKTTTAIRVDQFLDDAELLALQGDGYQITNPRAQTIYQYFRLGYTLKTPWPWVKFTYGMAVGYHYFNFDFYFHKADRSTRLSFFNANEEFFGIVRFVSLAAYEGESLNVLKTTLLTQDKVKISNPDRDLELAHLFLSVELFSWSFYF